MNGSGGGNAKQRKALPPSHTLPAPLAPMMAKHRPLRTTPDRPFRISTGGPPPRGCTLKVSPAKVMSTAAFGCVAAMAAGRAVGSAAWEWGWRVGAYLVNF